MGFDSGVWIPVFVAVVSAIASVGAVFIQARKDKEKIDAETTEIIVRASEDALKLSGSTYEARILYLMTGIELLIQQIEAAGMDPVWRPRMNGKG